jgi:hypothetical protein
MIMNERSKFGSARAVSQGSVLELTELFVMMSSDPLSATHVVPNDVGRRL